MSERRSAGLAWNLASAALPLVGSFLVSVLLAPHVGDAAWGTYSLVMSVATLALVIAKFGVHTATSRLVSENEDAPGPWIRAGIFWRGVFTLAVAAVALVVSPWLARSFDQPATGPFWLVAPIVIAVSAFEFGTEILVGLRAFRQQMVSRVVFLAIRLAAIGVVRWFELGIFAFLVGHALGQALPAVAMLGSLLWVTRGRATVPAAEARQRTLELSIPLAFGSASYLLYAHTDRLMLGWFVDAAAVGQFAVARNVLDAALFPLVALTWSLRPALTRALAGRGDESPREVLAEGLRLSIVYAFGGAALCATLGPPLLGALYGVTYAEAADLLLWMTPLLFLRGLGAVIFPALVAADAQGAYARLMVWTAVANIGANLALIPTFGARGAIAATVAALAVLSWGGFASIRRSLGAVPWRDQIGHHLLAAASSLLLALGLWRWGPAEHGLVELLLAAAVGSVWVLGINLPARPWWQLRSRRG